MKIPITIRVDVRILDKLKAQSKHYQTVFNDILKQAKLPEDFMLPWKAPTQRITIRLDRDVIKRLRDTCPLGGYQTLINMIMLKELKI